jgi:hypothetical protein
MGQGLKTFLSNSAKGLTAPRGITWPGSHLEKLSPIGLNEVSAFEASKAFWACVHALKLFTPNLSMVCGSSGHRIKPHSEISRRIKSCCGIAGLYGWVPKCQRLVNGS